MQFTPDMQYEIDRADAMNPGDPAAATMQAEAAIRALPEFAASVDAMVTDTIRAGIYAARHRANVAIKRASGQYGQAAIVDNASPVVARVYESVYQYRIGGRTLGTLSGAELIDVANREAATADGHRFNAELCKWLAERVPPDKLAKDVVSEAVVAKEFERLRRRSCGRDGTSAVA